MKNHIDILLKELFISPSDEMFEKLLYSYLSSENYCPYEDLTDKRDLLDLYIEKKDVKNVIKTSYEILKVKPYDIESHILIARFASLINKPNITSLHNYIANLRRTKIMNRSGKSITEAIDIIYPEDELFFFKVNNLNPQKRLPHEENGQFFDVYFFEDGSKYFFDITKPFLTAIEEDNSK